MVIIQESAKSKGKRYRCPYCQQMFYREDLVNHIAKEHEELIPDGYTARRIVFNLINKKEVGNCVICRKEVNWNEDIGRYEKYCCEKCKAEASRIAEENLKRVTGMTKSERMSQADIQNNMLSNRSISGEYTFSTGGKRSYVGSYERKALEFFDTVFNLRAIHVQTPGPVVEYEINGEKHFWITDQYIEPWNLVIDCKDGGDNPNKRDMPEYRAKQDAKEKAIAEQGKYNYIRLTNNNFEQIFEIVMEIKSQLLLPESERHPVIRINESVSVNTDITLTELPIMESTVTDMTNTAYSILENCIKQNKAYVIVYEEKGDIEVKYAITDVPDMDRNVVVLHDDKEDKTQTEVVNDKWFENHCNEFAMFEFKPSQYINYDFSTNLLETMTQMDVISEEQILYDSKFKRVPTPKELNEAKVNALTNTLLKESKGFPLPHVKNPLYENVTVFRSLKGLYLENDNTGFRSGYYQNDIPDYVFKLVEESIL